MDLLLNVDRLPLLVPERVVSECKRAGIDVRAAAQVFCDPCAQLEEWACGGGGYTLTGRRPADGEGQTIKFCVYRDVLRVVSVQPADPDQLQVELPDEPGPMRGEDRGPLPAHALATELGFA